MNIFVPAGVVAGIVLLITKSRLFACKRQFVTYRYKAAFVNGKKPSFVHRIFHAIMTCPMCSGAWLGMLVCYYLPIYNYFVDLVLVFFINWVFHEVEDVLFNLSEKLKKDLALPENRV